MHKLSVLTRFQAFCFCLTVFYCYLLSLSSPAFLFLSAVVQAVCFILHLIGIYGVMSLCIWSKHHIWPDLPAGKLYFYLPLWGSDTALAGVLSYLPIMVQKRQPFSGLPL